MSYHITCDGAYDRKREIGGWCAIVEESGFGTQKAYGQVLHTTNQRMELAAILGGINAAKEEQHVTLYSDSEYAIKILKGEYKAKVNLDLVEAIFTRIEEFDNEPIFTWLPRMATPQAREADRIAKLMTTLNVGVMEPSKLGSTDGIDGIDVETPADEDDAPTEPNVPVTPEMSVGEPPVGAQAMSEADEAEEVEEIELEMKPKKRRKRRAK